jgi:hypothetical protein
MPTKKRPDIPISSFASKLAKTKQNSPAFLTSGYVGAADDKTVRLFLDLTLDTYVDIPRSAVLHSQSVEDDQHQRAELMLDAGAQMTLVHQARRNLGPEDFQQALTAAREQQKNRAQPQPAAASMSAPSQAMNPCEVKPSCGCGGSVAESPAPAGPSEPGSGPDLLRRAGRAALGPFGFVLDLF